MVPNSSYKQQVLKSLLKASLPSGSFETAGPKADGTMFIRVRSTEEASADHLSYQLIDAFNKLKLDFTQTDDNKFRVPLNQFEVGK